MSRRLVLLVSLGLVAVFTITACDSGDSTGSGEEPGAYTVAADKAVEMLDDRTVIDVRTAAEYAESHVVGAANIDVEGADFADRIAELDASEPYMVYCRSGRRSALAAEQMAEAGIEDIADAGGLADLARAGAPIE